MKLGLLTVNFVLKYLKNGDIKRKKKIIFNENVHHNLKYGEKENNVLDIYYPDNSNGHLIIDIHGGIFAGGLKENNYKYLSFFKDQGFTVVNLDFSLINKKTDFIFQLKDICNAINFCYKNKNELNLDFNKVHIIGDSSGGYLSLEIAELLISKQYQNEIGVNLPDFNFNLLLNSPVYALKDAYEMGKKLCNKSGYHRLFSIKIDDENYLKLVDPETRISLLKDISVFVSTSNFDFLQSHSIKLYNVLKTQGTNIIFNNVETTDKKIGHIHNIIRINYKEGIETNNKMLEFMINEKL